MPGFTCALLMLLTCPHSFPLSLSPPPPAPAPSLFLFPLLTLPVLRIPSLNLSTCHLLALSLPPSLCMSLTLPALVHRRPAGMQPCSGELRGRRALLRHVLLACQPPRRVTLIHINALGVRLLGVLFFLPCLGLLLAPAPMFCTPCQCQASCPSVSLPRSLHMCST